MEKSYKHHYFYYLLGTIIVWTVLLLLRYFDIGISYEFLNDFLKTIISALIAIIALAFTVQIPRLAQFSPRKRIKKKDEETEEEIKNNWKKFLQRFVMFIIFILAMLLFLEFVTCFWFMDFVLTITIVGMHYIFKSTFSFVKNI